MKKFITIAIASLSILLSACGSSPADKKEEMRNNGYINMGIDFIVHSVTTDDDLREFVAQRGSSERMEFLEASISAAGNAHEYAIFTDGMIAPLSVKAKSGDEFSIYYTMTDDFTDIKDMRMCNPDMECYEITKLMQLHQLY